MINILTQLLQSLNELEAIADADARRTKAEGNTDLYEWYDGLAHGLLRAKELIQEVMDAKEDAQ